MTSPSPSRGRARVVRIALAAGFAIVALVAAVHGRWGLGVGCLVAVVLCVPSDWFHGGGAGWGSSSDNPGGF